MLPKQKRQPAFKSYVNKDNLMLWFSAHNIYIVMKRRAGSVHYPHSLAGDKHDNADAGPAITDAVPHICASIAKTRSAKCLDIVIV